MTVSGERRGTVSLAEASGPNAKVQKWGRTEWVLRDEEGCTSEEGVAERGSGSTELMVNWATHPSCIPYGSK